MGVGVIVADLGFQLAQVEGSVGEGGHRGGVDTGQLRNTVARIIGEEEAGEEVWGWGGDLHTHFLPARRCVCGRGRPRSPRRPAPRSAPSLRSEADVLNIERPGRREAAVKHLPAMRLAMVPDGTNRAASIRNISAPILCSSGERDNNSTKARNSILY